MTLNLIEKPVCRTCSWCEELLKGEELENLSIRDGEMLCDNCDEEWRADNMFRCVQCDCLESVEYRGIPGTLFVAFNDEADVDPGVYEVTDNPYYTSDMLSMWLNKEAVRRIGDIPEGLVQDWFPIEHFCRDCSEKLKDSLMSNPTPGQEGKS